MFNYYPLFYIMHYLYAVVLKTALWLCSLSASLLACICHHWMVTGTLSAWKRIHYSAVSSVKNLSTLITQLIHRCHASWQSRWVAISVVYSWLIAILYWRYRLYLVCFQALVSIFNPFTSYWSHMGQCQSKNTLFLTRLVGITIYIYICTCPQALCIYIWQIPPCWHGL